MAENKQILSKEVIRKSYINWMMYNLALYQPSAEYYSTNRRLCKRSGHFSLLSGFASKNKLGFLCRKTIK